MLDRVLRVALFSRRRYRLFGSFIMNTVALDAILIWSSSGGGETAGDWPTRGSQLIRLVRSIDYATLSARISSGRLCRNSDKAESRSRLSLVGYYEMTSYRRS